MKEHLNDVLATGGCVVFREATVRFDQNAGNSPKIQPVSFGLHSRARPARSSNTSGKISGLMVPVKYMLKHMDQYAQLSQYQHRV